MDSISNISTPYWLSDALQHIWLPYTQMKSAPSPLPVVSAQGSRIRLADGNELIDGIASWWSACHGYQHPHIVKQIRSQLDSLSHIMFGGLAHEPAYKLAARLVNITPKGLSRVFFSDSGSTAVEVAMKMAVQYWYNNGNHQKSKFVCFRHAYHGDTMGCMSVADPDEGMHSNFNNFMPRQYVMDIPNDEYSLAEFKEMLDGIKRSVAAVIIEPLVQCAGGMKFHSADILAEIHRICKARDILFIADEVATGFGRTGSIFACDEAGITPDIMCLGKALTGGFIGLAATLASDKVFEAFLSDKLEAAFMHGPTFMANPLACAAANASLDLFEQEPRMQQVEDIEMQLREELRPCRKLDNVVDVRVKGAIGVVQLDNPDWNYICELRRQFISKGVWLRPFGDMIYIMPAFTILSNELGQLTKSVQEILAQDVMH